MSGLFLLGGLGWFLFLSFHFVSHCASYSTDVMWLKNNTLLNWDYLETSWLWWKYYKYYGSYRDAITAFLEVFSLLNSSKQKKKRIYFFPLYSFPPDPNPAHGPALFQSISSDRAHTLCQMAHLVQETQSWTRHGPRLKKLSHVNLMICLPETDGYLTAYNHNENREWKIPTSNY